MKSTNASFFDRILFALFALICFWSVGQFVFARFVLYHAQYRVLDPAHYTVDVVPIATMPDKEAPPRDGFRKSNDGTSLVKVTTLGTAHHIDRTITDLLPFFIFGIAGLGMSIYSKRKRATNDAQSCAAANSLRCHAGCFQPPPFPHHAASAPAPRVAELGVVKRFCTHLL